MKNYGNAKKYEPVEVREVRKEAISNEIVETFIAHSMSSIAAIETLEYAIKKVRAISEELDNGYSIGPYQI